MTLHRKGSHPATAKAPVKYDGFPPAAVRTLVEQVTAIGVDKCWLKVYRNDKGEAMLQVVRLRPKFEEGSADDADPPAINSSWICPPFCFGPPEAE